MVVNKIFLGSLQGSLVLAQSRIVYRATAFAGLAGMCTQAFRVQVNQRVNLSQLVAEHGANGHLDAVQLDEHAVTQPLIKLIEVNWAYPGFSDT
ncbi:Hypothetical protein PFREUD_21330 [Propionibacterium freudenreichii subsp. shermanii CIRM-BIA1]|uniref:Uncharacterized protein n=1 Tax=Propionibacterium freudenreichii subsp. shermanii (strain ATCC 9614 / DSM 4902 / CIP 103027 / NCIMB 8099 / CIRM-BIA1) TaxID=754252 RepID=D7GGH3_PROFC|nr:Hypothetical protein PFREUD_21330 [Propionibacterium freudenreichii subsp. shermanii CIRM-BIA1]